jgi:uncharacterized membrane protein YhhN
MSFSLIGVTLAVAALDWFAVAKGLRKLEYLAKPAVMLALIAWLLLVGGFHGALLWFTLGAIFSLIGDVFLILPKEQFIPAIISFLLAHLAYIIGLNPTLPPLHFASIALFIIVLLLAAQVYRPISKGCVDKGTPELNRPVLVYTIAISAMLLSALLTLVRPDSEWTPWAALLVSAGAILFFISDSVLAWCRFIQPIPANRLIVIVSYHLGQLGILIGAVVNFLPR